MRFFGTESIQEGKTVYVRRAHVSSQKVAIEKNLFGFLLNVDVPLLHFVPMQLSVGLS